MNGRAIAGVALAAHGAFSAYAVAQDGFWSVFPPFASWAQWQMFADLAVACTLALVWIAGDLHARGRSRWGVLPWVGGVALLGSISPLLYLVLRSPDAADAVAA